MTASDIRDLVLSLEPDLARVEVTASEDGVAGVEIILLPTAPAQPGRVSGARLRFIGEYLAARVPLGLRVRVREACFVSQVIEVREAEAIADLASIVDEVVGAWIDPVSGGPDGRGYPIGAPLLEDDIDARLRERFSVMELSLDSLPAITCRSITETAPAETPWNYPLISRVHVVEESHEFPRA